MRQHRKEEFVIYPICMTMNKAKLEPRFNVQKQKNYFTREVLSTNKWMIANCSEGAWPVEGLGAPWKLGKLRY